MCGASYVQELLRCVWRHLVGVLKGESPTLCYTSSLLHTLGSVTVSMAGGTIVRMAVMVNSYFFHSCITTKTNFK